MQSYNSWFCYFYWQKSILQLLVSGECYNWRFCANYRWRGILQFSSFKVHTTAQKCYLNWKTRFRVLSLERWPPVYKRSRKNQWVYHLWLLRNSGRNLCNGKRFYFWTHPRPDKHRRNSAHLHRARRKQRHQMRRVRRDPLCGRCRYSPHRPYAQYPVGARYVQPLAYLRNLQWAGGCYCPHIQRLDHYQAPHCHHRRPAGANLHGL